MISAAGTKGRAPDTGNVTLPPTPSLYVPHRTVAGPEAAKRLPLRPIKHGLAELRDRSSEVWNRGAAQPPRSGRHPWTWLLRRVFHGCCQQPSSWPKGMVGDPSCAPVCAVRLHLPAPLPRTSYSSHLSSWRAARKREGLAGLQDKRPGSKPTKDAKDWQIEQQQKQIAKVENELRISEDSPDKRPL
jgi:hypothetical protein